MSNTITLELPRNLFVTLDDRYGDDDLATTELARPHIDARDDARLDARAGAASRLDRIAARQRAALAADRWFAAAVAVLALVLVLGLVGL